MAACTESGVKGCIAAHSITNMFYILRKDYDSKERRDVLANLCSLFDIEGIDKAKLIAGLENDNFADFEDCLQAECAKTYVAEYIVTRNIEDYKESEIEAILPRDYLRQIQTQV